ncbi:MAG: hypothetical protein K8T89_04580, partial [Planctomycetes bacterium]|nr:hypothetical protein [Planctomycetota bacterium]
SAQPRQEAIGRPQNPDIDVARKERTPKNDAEFAPIKSVTALPERAVHDPLLNGPFRAESMLNMGDSQVFDLG